MHSESSVYLCSSDEERLIVRMLSKTASSLRRRLSEDPSGETAPVARIRSKPVSPLTSEMIALRYALAADLPAGPCVVQFTAPGPGQGTSTLALEFSRVVAWEENAQVLLVSAEPDPHRRPPHFDACGPHGLLDLAGGHGAIDDAVAVSTETPDLAFATLYGMHTGALAGLQNNALNTILGAVRGSFSMVVIDSPAATNPTTAMLSRACDGVVLVVDAKHTHPAAAQGAKQRIERAGGRIAGAVMNRHGRWKQRN
jgi:Mrp family chromosome partitioning ATPase